MRTSAWLGASLALAVDQLTKSLAFATVAARGEMPITTFFTITSGMNPGIAFGLATRVHPLILIGIAAAISAVLAMMILRSESPLRRTALGMILGGAFGNIVDRIRFGAVRDLIDLHWGGWHWPTFNLADAFITIGVLILLAFDPADRDQHKKLRLPVGEQRSSGSKSK